MERLDTDPLLVVAEGGQGRRRYGAVGAADTDNFGESTVSSGTQASRDDESSELPPGT